MATTIKHGDGHSVGFRVSVANGGADAIGGITVEFLYGGTLYASTTTFSLNPGQTSNIDTGAMIDPTEVNALTPGTYNLVVNVKVGGTVVASATVIGDLVVQAGDIILTISGAGSYLI